MNIPGAYEKKAINKFLNHKQAVKQFYLNSCETYCIILAK